MDWTIWMFITVAVVVFGIAMIALGFFSGYFGKGKNRSFGAIMAVAGVIVLAVWLYLCLMTDIAPFCDVNVYDLIHDLIIQLVALLVGVLVAAGIFLVTVLKA